MAKRDIEDKRFLMKVVGMKQKDDGHRIISLSNSSGEVIILSTPFGVQFDDYKIGDEIEVNLSELVTNERP